MKAAAYCRKSTIQNGDERELSVERQKVDCIAFIEKQGWSVGKIYTEEDGTSGTIDHEDRPQLAALLADAKKKPRPFDVLVVWRDDRLSREGAGAITLLNTLTRKCGVRVFYAQSGKEVSLRGTGLVLHSVEAYGSEAYAEKIQTDTQAARLRRFRTIEAWASGSPPYGFKTERRGAVEGDRRSGHSVLVIDPEQSATVKRIFEAVANGDSVRGLARQLTQEGVVAPRGRAGWRLWTTSLICRNQTYTGTTTFNGESRHSEKIRLVSDQLFAKAQRVLDKNVARYAPHRETDGRLKGRPEGSGKLPVYAFADLLVCGICGSKLWFVKDPRSGVVRARCKLSIGPSGACRNSFGAPYTKVQDAVISLIRRVSPEDLKALYENEAAKRSTNVSSIAVEVAAKRREIEALDRKIARLVAAIEDGQPVGNALKDRKAEKDTAEVALAELEARQAEANLAAFDWPSWIAEAAKFPEVLRTVLANGAVQGTPGLHGRQLLRVLFPKPITVTPVIEDGRPKDWDIKTSLNTDPLFEAVASATSLRLRS